MSAVDVVMSVMTLMRMRGVEVCISRIAFNASAKAKVSNSQKEPLPDKGF